MSQAANQTKFGWIKVVSFTISDNRSIKSWLQDRDIEMCSTHNESVAAAKLIRTLKKEIYKYMTSASKNVYADKLDDIVNKYNNTYHSTIKMKLVN